jgi:hypothetical protein
MNDYQTLLERAVDKRLKALPELPAPHGLVREVMALLERRARLPWYARSLMNWPLPIQALSLLIFAAVLGGLVFATWKVTQADVVMGALHQFAALLSGLDAYYQPIAVVGSSAGLLIKQVGIGFWISCLLIAGMAYAACLALGTVYYRIGYARR